MPRLVSRILLSALIGAAVTVVCLWIASAIRPGVTLEMDRDLPALTSGFYRVERDGNETFAWTAEHATMSLPGLDRHVPWTCAIRARAARPRGTPRATFVIAVDGATVDERDASGEYETLIVHVPVRDGLDGLTLSLRTTPPFTPGASDRRTLGSRIDRVECSPASGRPFAPRAAFAAVAVSGAIAGAGLALALSSLHAFIALAAIGAAHAVALSIAPGLYDAGYLKTLPLLTLWVTVAAAITTWMAARLRRITLSAEALGAVAVSSVLLIVELTALLHPAKLVIDALFHAHRLELVMSGTYLFTQVMPDGVRFPYAIALYVVSAPFARFTPDHVAVLKIVVCAWRAAAGLCLYPLVARTWGDRRAALLAVAASHATPLPFEVIGFANLTFAFGQSVALMALAAAGSWSLARSRPLLLAAFTGIASLAFLSHVGVFPVLFVMLAAAAGLYIWRGDSELRHTGWMLLALTVLAATVSVVTYYGHFEESYRTLRRVRQSAEVPASPSAPAAGANAERTPATIAAVPLSTRAWRAARFLVRGAGWPLVVLAAIGAIHLAFARAPDRLTLLSIASALAYVAFVGWTVTMTVELRFQRYAEEFVSRVTCLVLPVVVVLAARGATSLSRRGIAGAAVLVLLLMASAVVGTHAWLTWLR